MKECQQCKSCYPDEVSVCPEDGMPTFHTISGEPVLEGKYKLEKRLGQGGMGVVYCSRHAYLKTQHAIKVILPDLVGNDPQLVTRFRQEALAAAAIRHHNVIAVTDFGVAAGTMPFLVMEFVEGESLSDLLEREKKLSPEKAFELMAAICAGVGEAHKQGIVHRDLKPLNIMIQKNRDSMASAVKILDFGLAKIKSGELLGSFIQAQTTGLMGSPYYMAPEQWADEDPDQAADIYSLGVMLFQMVAGDVPFKGSSIPAIMQKHLNNQPPSFAEFGVSVSPQFELAVRHTLEKDRHKRTASSEVMVEELRNAIGIASQSIGYQTGGIHVSKMTGSLPVSTLHILTNPPQAKIFVNDVSIGQSQPDGWLLLEGIQSGNHRLRVSHDGFEDWNSEVFFDGTPKQIVAQLKNLAAQFNPNNQTGNISQQVNQTGNISQPINQIGNISQPMTGASQYDLTHGSQYNVHQTGATNVQNQMSQTGQQPGQQTWQDSQRQFAQTSTPVLPTGLPPTTPSALKFVIIGILGLLAPDWNRSRGAYLGGFIGAGNSNVKGGVNTSNPTPSVVPATPAPAVPKVEMVKIPGGKFMMGRNDGAVLEKPEHPVEVKSFWMDKTEVTNAEFSDFVKEKGYSPIPANWEGGKPLPNEELMPVRYVNQEDIDAFIEWRSARDKVTYRLPTEEEWEYAARNGSDDNLYPWGDKWEENRAVVNNSFVFEPVNSKPDGANKWGVLGLIGNVWELTGSRASAYSGADAQVVQQVKNKFGDTHLVVRGAFNSTKENPTADSTFRGFSPAKQRDKVIGFRLVRSE